MRELTAEDYVFSFKRFADPQVRSSSTWLEEAARLGLPELVKQARDSGRRFDYDRHIPGLRALDRYTLQIRTGGHARTCRCNWPLTTQAHSPARSSSSTASRWASIRWAPALPGSRNGGVAR